MGWFSKDKRGPEWKQGWTLSSTSLPPLPFLAFFAVVLLFLFMSQYTGYKSQIEKTMFNFQIFLFILPLLLIFAVRSIVINGMNFAFRFPRSRPAQHNPAVSDGATIGTSGSSSSPWGVAALLVLLLLMISYKSSIDSQWLRPLWRSD